MTHCRKMVLMCCNITGLVLLTNVCVAGVRAGYSHTAKLHQDVIARFNRRIRPILNQKLPIVVHFRFYLLNLLGIVEVQEKLEFNAWVNFTWVDEIRVWDPRNYSGIEKIHPEPLDIWRPRTLVSNSVNARDVFEDDYSPMTLYYNGITRWYPGGVFSASCFLDITYFPFDEQSCYVDFFTNDFADEIHLIPTIPFVLNDSFIPNGEWVLLSSDIKEQEKQVGDETFSSVVIRMSFQRRPHFFLVNVIVPMVLLSLLSSFVFVMPSDSGERATFSITVLLSLSLFMSVVSNQLPNNSDTFPIIMSYLFALLLHSSVCVMVSICQLRAMYIFLQKQSNACFYLSPSSLRSVLFCSIPKKGSLDTQHDVRAKSQSDTNNNDARPMVSEARGTPADSKSIIHEANSQQTTSGVHVADKSFQAGTSMGTLVYASTVDSEQVYERRGCWSTFWGNLHQMNDYLFIMSNVIWLGISVYFFIRLVHRK